MKKHSGNTMAQYAIIIALVALAIVPVFLAFGQTITKCFDDFYNGFKSDSSQIVVKDSENPEIAVVKGGSLGGTPANPVKKCSGNKCTIDFGEYILTGIPADFNQIMMSSGSSGTTESMIELLEQIADQLEEKGDLPQAENLRELANVAHLIATVEKNAETTAKSCMGNEDIQCFKSNLYTTAIDIPDNISDLFTSDQLATGGQVILDANNVYPAAPGLDSFSSPGSIYKKLYTNILNSSEYSDTTKDIVSALSENINDLGYKAQKIITATYSLGNDSITKYDLQTGDVIETENTGITSDMDINYQQFFAPQSSTGTNYNAVLICATGGTPDDGTKCN